MPQEIWASEQRAVAGPGLLVALVAAVLTFLPSAILHAQSPAVHGYITAVHPPDGFDVNGEHVVTTPDTQFGVIGAKTPQSNGPMREAVEIGAWVEVFAERDRTAKIVTARTVLFRDAAESKLSGLAVIEKVISNAPELVFAADGYRIRVTSATEIKFPKDVEPQADVHSGMWTLYEGRLGKDGLLVADKVRFLSTKHAKAKSEKVSGNSSAPAVMPQPPANPDEAAKNSAPPPDSASGQTEVQSEVRGKEIQFDDITYRISKDPALQSRVLRVAGSLIPEYQKQMPANDPSKIHFLFIAIDAPWHEVHTSSDEEGVILVPAKLVARFKNDDQLAAVLADGIAYSLQQQAPMVIQLNRTTLEEAAGVAAVSFIPYAGPFAELVGGQAMRNQHERALQEERWRVALELMADAGYDPWQAPEAWRLAEAKKVPADTSALKYPERSGYQFGILNLMYPKTAPVNATESGSTANTSASGKP
jgi:hypothetical protein